MIAALGTLVFIHRRQRLRRHQALREYYFEQMELSRVRITLAVQFAVVDSRVLPLFHTLNSFRRSIAVLHSTAVGTHPRTKEQ